MQVTQVEKAQLAQFVITFDGAVAHYRVYFGNTEPIDLGEAVLPFNHGSNDPRSSIQWVSTHLRERFDLLLSSAIESQRSALWQSLSDGQRMRNEGWQGLTDISVTPQEAWNFDRLMVAAMFYKALSLALRSSERYIAMEAWLVYTFATWQWYNLVKLALELRPPSKGAVNLPLNQLTDEQAAVVDAQREFASAYAALVPVLTGERFVSALRWFPIWAGKETANGPLLREALRLSMVLSEASSRRPLPQQFDLGRPIDAPGCFHSGGLRWDTVRLHPMFCDSDQKDARAEVRRLISSWLLPRYDFESALRLSRLLRAGGKALPTQLWSLPHWAWWLEGLLGMFFLAVLFAGSCSFGGGTGLLGIWIASSGSVACPPCIAVLELAAFSIPAVLLFLLLDRQTLQYFALPRVIGGVFIGYLALALQQDSIQLVSVFWLSRFGADFYWAPVIVWVVVMGMGLLYLVADTNALVRHGATAFRRAGQTLGSVLLVSALSGLLVVALTTLAYSEVPPEMLRRFFLGPFGWVSLYEYLLFVPLALFTGLVTQFIFEEQSVTASVWAAEQE